MVALYRFKYPQIELIHIRDVGSEEINLIYTQLKYFPKESFFKLASIKKQQDFGIATLVVGRTFWNITQIPMPARLGKYKT
jgi:hypothetical protein